MMNIILSVIIFIVMFLLAATAESLLSRNDEGEEKIFAGNEPKEVIKRIILSSEENNPGRALLIASVPTVTNLLLTKAPDLAVVFGLALIATMVYVGYWWHKGGSEVIEMLPFIGMEIILFLELKAVASIFSAKLALTGTVQSVVSIIPVVLLIGSIGFFVVDALAYNNKVNAKRAAAVTTIVAMALTVFVNLKGGATPIATAAPEPWYHFYNSDLQSNEDKDDDFNFGPSAYTETTTAEEADKEFRKRISKDPALGAADMAWLDSIVKTRFIGVFYDEAEGAWDAAINKAKEGWLKAGEDEYKKVVNTFFNFLDKAKVEIIERTSGLDDQMYMNPVTTDGVPDVIVLETENHTGHFIRYTFEIKGEEFTVEYRLECGFQPCNVEAQMGIVPQNRNVVPTVNPSPEPTPTPEPEPEPEPKPDPEPKKDPSKSKVLPNDDDGPGENTNNPGKRESTKDKPTNSNHMTYPEYRKVMEDLKNINETQKTGEDPNEPSTPTPSGTTVHNNGNEGTGNGGANTPTPVTPPATADETKKQTSGATTEAGQKITSEPQKHWAGPAD